MNMMSQTFYFASWSHNRTEEMVDCPLHPISYYTAVQIITYLHNAWNGSCVLRSIKLKTREAIVLYSVLIEQKLLTIFAIQAPLNVTGDNLQMKSSVTIWN